MLFKILKSDKLIKSILSKKNFIYSNKKLLSNMDVIPIEALSDNYMYLIIDKETRECAAVDPVEPKKILEQVKRNNLKLKKILTTHHHW